MRSGKTDQLIRMVAEALEDRDQNIVIAVPTKSLEGRRIMHGIERYLRNSNLIEFARPDKIKLKNGSQAAVYSTPPSVRGVPATEVFAHWDAPWQLVHDAQLCERDA